MDIRRLKIIVSVTIVSIVAVAVSIGLLRSLDVAVALYVIGLIAALLFLDPFVGLVIYVAFLYIRPQDFIPALQSARMMLVIGGATLGSMLVRRTFEGKSIRLLHTPLDGVMWYFLLSVVLSHLTHMDTEGALRSGLNILRIVVLYFLITNLLASERKLSMFAHVLALLTLVLAAQGIVQYYTGVGIAGQTTGREQRIQSLEGFENPNALAMAVLVALPFFYFDLGRFRKLPMRIYSAIGVATLLFALYLTNSRGGMVGLGGMATILLVRKTGWVKGVVLSVAVCALIFFLGPSRMSTISAYEPSAYGRILAWADGFRLLASSPLFGIGAGVWGSWEYPHLVAHNSFLHCAAELGIVGLPAWVMLIFLSMRFTYFVGERSGSALSKNLQLNAQKIFFAFVAYVLTMVFISKTYNALLYIIIGLAGATINIFVEQNREHFVLLEKKDLLYGLLITFGGLVGFKLFVMIVGV